MICATYVAIALKETLDSFLAVLGAVLCAPLAILFPALIHLKAKAKTNGQKIVDIILVVIAVLVLLFCTAQSCGFIGKKAH